MKRNRIFMLIAALTLTLALAGCGEAPAPANDAQSEPMSETISTAPETELPGMSETMTATEAVKNYLQYFPMSRQGMIDQLSNLEGYSVEEATAGVDASDVDWYEQALRKAKGYLEAITYTPEELIDQLEYDKFTPEEAMYAATMAIEPDNDLPGMSESMTATEAVMNYLQYFPMSRQALIDQLSNLEGYSVEEATAGVDASGVDWNEQAVRQAKGQLNTMSYTRDELIDQLEYEKFTHEEAVYGVDHCGATW
ncbi:MAG: Ltp family lipoprotein [Oscillibacter sp.]|nr:Ltp family lipoprotein [Oscillibacter sp.]